MRNVTALTTHLVVLATCLGMVFSAPTAFAASGPDGETLTASAPTINGAPSTGSAKVGDTIGTTFSVNVPYDESVVYSVVIGKIEGPYKGDSESCVDVQNGVDTPTYGAGTLSAAQNLINPSTTFDPANSRAQIVRPDLGSDYRIIAFVFKRPQGTDYQPGTICQLYSEPRADGTNMGLLMVDGYNFTVDGGSPGGGDVAPPTPKPIQLNNATAFGGTSSSVGAANPGIDPVTHLADGGTIDSVGAITTQILQNNPAAALCTAMTFRLPGNAAGSVSLGTAGILGICNTRPLLMNLINILSILAGIFFVTTVIYSGIMLVQASSDDVAAKAKRNLIWSAIGAILVILSNWIVPYIIYVIANATA